MKSVVNCVCRYVEPESLVGDNQYSHEQFGKQDAECTVCFSHLPPVLHLHLKRFEFNMSTYTMEKVYTRDALSTPPLHQHSLAFLCFTTMLVN